MGIAESFRKHEEMLNMMDILTEAEAKTRKCPYSFGAPRYTMANPDKTEYATVELFPPNCIAGECMAWRLAHKPSANGDETGFCGAFGVPRHT